MDDATRQRIEARVEQLKQERDQFVAQANQQLAGYNAALNELEQLLKPAAEQAAP